jgi:hypothetical protein
VWTRIGLDKDPTFPPRALKKAVFVEVISTEDPLLRIESFEVSERLISSIGPFRRIDPAVTVTVLMLSRFVKLPKEASPDPVSIVRFSPLVP